MGVSLREAIDLFLEYQQYRKSRAKTTIDTYRSALHMFADNAHNPMLDDLTIEMVDDYAKTLLACHMSSKTVKNRLTPIRSMIKFLYAKRMTDLIPEQIDLSLTSDNEAKHQTTEVKVILIDACDNLRDRALIKCLLRSGMRVSELIQAKTCDLYDRSLVIPNGKGGKPRITFITTQCDAAIKAYHATLDNPTYLFPARDGSMLSRQYICRLVTEVAKRSGIKKHISPHTLRHTFATNLLMKGARIEDVQPMMGHANIKTTRIYLHFTNDYLHARYEQAMNDTLPVEYHHQM